MRNFPFLVCAVSASAMLGAVNVASADSIISGDLSDPTYSGSFLVTADGYVCASFSCTAQSSRSTQNITGSGSLSYSGAASLISDGSVSIPPSNYTPGATASGSFSFSQNPSPSMKMAGTASTVAVNGATAAVSVGNATMIYNMLITGPTSSVDVQVDAHGGVTVSSIAAGGSFNNFAQISFGIAGQFFDNALVGAGNGLITDAFNDTNTYTLATNHLYSLELDGHLLASVSGNLGGGTATYSGFIDPTFTVVGDDPGAYTLSFSPGIGNSVGAVPEPSTWAMMILGFCGLCFIGFRRKSKQLMMAI